MYYFLRKKVKSIFNAIGYEIFRKYYYDFNSDDSIRKILRLASIDTGNTVIFDVGANVGQSVDRFRKYLPDAFIFSFEPSPGPFEELATKHANDRGIKCFNLGLGSCRGELPFFLNPDSGSNSFYKLNLDGESFKLGNTEEARKNHNATTLKEIISYNTEIRVSVNTLNNICLEEGVKRVEILKIDTQGFELEILRGATDILPNTLIVEAEVMFSDTYERSPRLGELESFMSEFGFVLWEIPYIGKFATSEVNRINFVDVHFVNLALLNDYKNDLG